MTSTQQPRYTERLWPSVGVAAFCLLMIVSMGIAVGYMYGFQLGLVVTIALVVVATLGTVLFTVNIEVSPAGLRAGKALLPWHHVGPVTVLDRTTTARARSANAHPSAYFNVRSWIAESVIIQVDDVNDPHPYWHLSSRNANKLATAIESQRGETQESGAHNGE